MARLVMVSPSFKEASILHCYYETQLILSMPSLPAALASSAASPRAPSAPAPSP